MRELGYQEKADYLYVKSPNEMLLADGIAMMSTGN
jgi:hypothetical protein